MADKWTRIDQIRAAHTSARPKQSNPAWANSHRDVGFLLEEIDKLRELLRQEAEFCAGSGDTDRAAQLFKALEGE